MANWNESLCGCFSSLGFCLLVTFMPCFYPVYQGYIVNKATKEPWWKACCCPLCCCCIGGAVNRGKIRDRYLINGHFCSDCLAHYCCWPCAICQEYREVTSREGN